jgi:kinesin family protein 4/21/27
MENQEAAAAHQQKDSVKVAVNIRPLITVELQDGCTDCVTVTPREPQVPICLTAGGCLIRCDLLGRI